MRGGYSNEKNVLSVISRAMVAVFLFTVVLGGGVLPKFENGVSASIIRYEAENAEISGATIEYNMPGASGGNQVGGIDLDDYVKFNDLPASSSVVIGYASEFSGTFSVYVNDEFNQKVSFWSTGGWSGYGNYGTVTLNINIPAGASLKFQHNYEDNHLNLDYIELDVTEMQTTTQL